MAVYGFAPQQPSSYFGGSSLLGGGMGQALYGGLLGGMDINNRMRQMQDANAISPYAVSGAQARLTADRIGSLFDATTNQGELEKLIRMLDEERNRQMGTPQPTSSVALASATDPATAAFNSPDAIARALGTNAVATPNPLSQSGMSQASQMLGLPRYSFNQPLGMNMSWGF